jgi:hypothetical protein
MNKQLNFSLLYLIKKLNELFFTYCKEETQNNKNIFPFEIDRIFNEVGYKELVLEYLKNYNSFNEKKDEPNNKIRTTIFYFLFYINLLECEKNIISFVKLQNNFSMIKNYTTNKEDETYIALLKKYFYYNNKMKHFFNIIKEKDYIKINIKNNQLKKKVYTFLEAIEILKNNDQQACIVGGSVRDILLNNETIENKITNVKDFDFVSSLSYDKLIELFKSNGFNVDEAGKRFLVLIVSKNGASFEIANFRKDGTYIDGRRPESVDIGTLEEDAQRRDLTINALYYNLKENVLLDPSEKGVNDLHKKILRFVGNPDYRIQEDYLRTFRFYRFLATKEDFKADEKSLKAARKNFEIACKNTSPSRIMNEIEKMCKI